MKRRSGATLVEVLVAIFVMGIGLMALLALFPLGALQMAKAIKDDRTGHIAANAAAAAKIKDVRHDSAVTPAYTAQGGFPSGTSASYPVLVDPMGYRLQSASSWSGTTSYYVGGTSGIPRTGVSYVSSQADYDRWFTFLDDITFQENGTPDTATTGSVQREGRYTWAYLCQKNDQSDVTPTAAVNLSVVVFEKRQMTVLGSQVAGETAYSADFRMANTNATLSWTSGDAPNVRKGTWILDNSSAAYQHGYFYRVVGVSSPGSNGANSIDVELHIPAKAKADASAGGSAVVMENVVEVFDRGTTN